MNLIQHINNFLGLFLDTFKLFGQVRVWLLLLAYFLFNWLLLYSHYHFYSPLFYGIVSPWLNLVNEQYAVGFSHYPGHFLLLPYFYGWAKFYAGFLFEGAVLGAAAILFFRALVTSDEVRFKTRNYIGIWINLMIAWIAINGLVALINVFLPELLSPLLRYSPRRQAVFEFVALPGLYIIILAMFYFTIPLVSIYKYSVFRAVKESLKMFVKRPIFSLFLAGFILIIPIIFSLLIGQQNTIVNKFKPEIVYWLILFSLFTDIFVNFFWMGTAVRHLLDRE